MDPRISRWAILVFCSSEDLRALHRRELKLGVDWPQGWVAYLPWLVQKNGLTPYWDPQMPDAEQANRIKEFEQAIYPCWAGIQKKWEETWGSPACEPEVTVLHRMDNAVWDAGHKPRRESEATAEVRAKKSVMGSSYSRVMGT